MLKTYRDKINQIPLKKRKEIYAILIIISIVCQEFIYINFMFLSIFFGYKLFVTVQTIKLIEVEEKTEFAYNEKTYNIEKAMLLLKIKYSRSMMHIMALSLFSSEKGEKVRSISLYRSEKEAFFLCKLMLDFQIEIEDLSENEAKKWLFNENAARYKEVFGKIEEA